MKTQFNKLNSTEQMLDQYGRRLATRLDASTLHISHDIGERLRVARLRALAAKKAPAMELVSASSLQRQGYAASLHYNSGEGSVWNRFASSLPIIALVVGVFVLFNFHDNKITSELAEVDAKLLIDDLPPSAYTDSGFLKFLQTTSLTGSDQNSGESSDVSSDKSSALPSADADQTEASNQAK